MCGEGVWEGVWGVWGCMVYVYGVWGCMWEGVWGDWGSVLA